MHASGAVCPPPLKPRLPQVQATFTLAYLKTRAWRHDSSSFLMDVTNIHMETSFSGLNFSFLFIWVIYCHISSFSVTLALFKIFILNALNPAACMGKLDLCKMLHFCGHVPLLPSRLWSSVWSFLSQNKFLLFNLLTIDTSTLFKNVYGLYV